MAARFSITLFDANQKIITGKSVTIKSGLLVYNLTESVERPGVYTNSSIPTGEKYTIYVENVALPEWSNFPIGGGVGEDAVFLQQHDYAGQHKDITVNSIIFV